MAKKAKVRQIPRRSNASKFVEEKHIGTEVIDWSSYPDEQSARMEILMTLRHYGYFYENKDGKKWAVQYAKKHLPKLAKKLEKINERIIGISLGGAAKIIMNGGPLNDRYLNKRLAEIVERAEESSTAASTEPLKKSKSPTALLAEKTSKLISEIETVVDDWENNVEFNTYDFLLKEISAYNTAKAVADYYTPQRQELEELVKKKTPDLIEAYSHLTLKQKRDYLKFISGIVADAEKFMASKKATRSVRKPKAKSNAQLVSKMKYAKTSTDFKVSSIDPQKIVGAQKVILFDTKVKTITILEASSTRGLTVKGTTIQDFEAARKKKLRKPEAALSLFSKATKIRLNGVFNKLTTKESVGNGRCNENTIILKVY